MTCLVIVGGRDNISYIMLCWSIKPFDWAGWRDAGLVVTAAGDGWGGTTDGAGQVR